MKRLHIGVIFGTRPEAIKLAPVIAELRRRDECTTTVLFTAQHRELVAPILAHFAITPDANFDVMQEAQSPAGVAARVLEHMENLPDRFRPDVVVVQGDTTTALAAALAAMYRNIPVVHVEAGLRSGNRLDPFPEEMNRRLISTLAALHCAATDDNRRNLLREGIAERDIVVTGNPVIDALLSIAADTVELPPSLRPTPGRRTVLLTTHRRENFGEPQQQIFRAVRRLADAHPDIDIIFPVHPNPAVYEPAHAALRGHERIRLVAPPDYITFVRLLSAAYLVLTDSGGLQEEAPALGKPVVVLRATTERPEILASGNAVLAGVDEERIVDVTTRLLTDAAHYSSMAHPSFPFGDGTASRAIVDAILRTFYRRLT